MGPAPWPFANRAALDQERLHRLREGLEILLQSNAFYARKLQGIDVHAATRDLLAFQSTIPVTTKEELSTDHAENPPFGSNLTYPIDAYSRLHQTSGSSGSPMRWPDTSEDWQWMLESWKQVYLAAGVVTSDRAFFGFSFGPFLGFWTAYEAATQLGILCAPGGGMTSLARLNAMRSIQATVLLCTPTYAIHLASVADQHAVDLREIPIRRIIVAGEPGGSVPATRQRIETLWNGATVIDHHGMTEIGPVSYSRPDQPSILRVYEKHYIAEILDPETLSPVPPASEGELVLTTLGRWGAPLIRYRTGDIVKSTPESDWARDDLGLDGGVIARADDMVTIRGVNVYPRAIEAIVRAHEAIDEYRVVIDSRNTLPEIKIEVEVLNQNATAAGALQSDLANRLNLRIPVVAVDAGSLPRFEMKAKRWNHLK